MLASLPYKWIIIPIGMIIGYFIVKAEPAVYVLMKQVEELTDGDISGKSMQISLSVGVAVSVGLSMLRVLCQISILYLLIPGYVIALILTRFVPKNIYSDSKLRIQHAGHESGAGWRSSRWDSASWKGCWNEKAGVTSKAGTIVFSLPVTSTAGLRSIEDI